MSGTGHFRKSVLKGRTKFDALFDRGFRVNGPGISLLACNIEEKTDSKLAVCVSKRAGNAVHRNRLKRITRESLNEVIPFIQSGYHLAIFPGRGFPDQDYAHRAESVRKLFKKAGLLKANR